MIDSNNIASLTGATVRDQSGDKVGTVGQVYVDPQDGRPLWATVRTGLFGTSESFVPLEDASWTSDEVEIRYEKNFVKDAPRIESDGELSSDDENALYSYYGIGSTSTSTSTDTDYVGTTGTDTRTDFDTTRGAGHDTSGPNTDDAMTRSEEQLHVGTERVSAGSARLRKYIVTENQSVTVPVSHEEVRLEREPITSENIGNATAGGDLTSEEHEVTLTADRVVVDKETVPVERVRLGKETVTEQQQVNEEVRKEQIEFVEGDGTTGSNLGDTNRTV